MAFLTYHFLVNQGNYGSDYEVYCLLDSGMCSGRHLLTLHREVLPPSSSLSQLDETHSSKTLVNFYQTTKHHISEGTKLQTVH
jgi:hypothetical protein